MTTGNALGIVLGTVLGAVVWLVTPLGRVTRAQGTTPQSTPETPTQKDDHQRSTDIYLYRTTARSGPKRGEELYYYKCWICHNQFAKAGPQLRDLFKRAKFATSASDVNDQTVADKIKMGGPGMPSFGATLKAADIADLIAYIKEGCCFDSGNPPPNPLYHGGH